MSWIRNTGFNDGSFEAPVVQRRMDGPDPWMVKIVGWLRRFDGLDCLDGLRGWIVRFLKLYLIVE
jgi:hypothetical protein